LGQQGGRRHAGRSQGRAQVNPERKRTTMSHSTHANDHGHGHGEAHDHHGPPAGFTRWMYTTNHKDIGTMYLWFSFAMFLTGGTMALLIRAELFQPGLQLVEPQFFNSLTTVHGLVMVFGA